MIIASDEINELMAWAKERMPGDRRYKLVIDTSIGAGPCSMCGGTGCEDSGGVTPWDAPIFVRCGWCNGTAEEPDTVTARAFIAEESYVGTFRETQQCGERRLA